jgi:hypothetical protein
MQRRTNVETNSNMPLGAAQVVTALNPEAKRKLIQAALDQFLAGQATEVEYEVFRDRHNMIASTAYQACQFLEAAAGRSVPFDIFYIWADTLRQRYLQSRSGRRSGLALSQEPVQVPAAIHLGQEDGNARE